MHRILQPICFICGNNRVRMTVNATVDGQSIIASNPSLLLTHREVNCPDIRIADPQPGTAFRRLRSLRPRRLIRHNPLRILESCDILKDTLLTYYVCRMGRAEQWREVNLLLY